MKLRVARKIIRSRRPERYRAPTFEAARRRWAGLYRYDANEPSGAAIYSAIARARRLQRLLSAAMALSRLGLENASRRGSALSTEGIGLDSSGASPRRHRVPHDVNLAIVQQKRCTLKNHAS